MARQSLTVRCLECVTQSPTPLRPVDVARKLSVPSNAVRAVLIRLADRGDVLAHRISGTRVEYTPPSSYRIHVLQRIIFGWRR